MSLVPWFAVAVGSALGGLLRYAATRTSPMIPGSWPLGTMWVNLAGGFTTFSTIAIGIVCLGGSGHLLRAAAHALVTPAGYVGAAWLSRALASHSF
jgi:fluoride ion exporter CrcB/FEX